MAYKVIKGKNKIRGEQTFVDNITGSNISASAYYGGSFTGNSISGSTGQFTYLTASAISASSFIGIADTTPKGPQYSLQFNSGSTFSGSANLIFDYTTNVLSGTTAQLTTLSASVVSASTFIGIPDTTPKGPEYSLQFNSGSTFSGSANLIFDYTTNILSGTITQLTTLTSSYISSSDINTTSITSSYYTGGSFIGTTVSGTTAQFTNITGSTITGALGLFTNITGTNAQLLNVSGTTAQFINLTSSYVSSSDIKTTSITSSFYIGGSFVGTTVSGTTAQFTTLSASYISASQIALTEFLDLNSSSLANPTYKQGRVFYDVDTGDPAFYTSVSGVKVDLGQQVVVRVKNSSGLPIAKGKLVHIVGGAGANALINTASWENDSNSANTLGMTMNAMNQNDFGFVLLNGVITDVNTDPNIFTAGQVIYLSSSGDYTPNKPQAPLHTVKVGEVIRAQQNVGSIFVNINNGLEIEELHDVRITSASAGDLLTYSSYNGTPVWVNTKTLSGSYVITGSLTISSSATFTNIGPAIFSGTINTNNNLSGTTAQFTSITASYISASTIIGVDIPITGNLLLTASATNDTITFTKGDSSTFSITINNVNNAVSSSYASNADLFDGRDSTTFANTGSNTFTGIQTFNQDITGTHAYFSGDLVINGTASIGMLETRNQQSLVVGDKYIVIMSGATDHTTLDGSGILFGSGSTSPTTDENGANAYVRYRNSYDALEVFPGLRVSGSTILTNTLTVTGSATFSSNLSGTTAQFTSITGSGGGLTNIPNGALVNSSITVGSTPISLGSSATTIQGISVLTGSTITGSTALFTQITASNISGTITNALTASYVNPLVQNVQITGNLNVSGNVQITGSLFGFDAGLANPIITITSGNTAVFGTPLITINQNNRTNNPVLQINNIGAGAAGIGMAAANGGSFGINNFDNTPTISVTNKNLVFSTDNIGWDSSQISYLFTETQKQSYPNQKTFLIRGNTSGFKTGSYFEIEKSGSLKLLELQGDPSGNVLFVSGTINANSGMIATGSIILDSGSNSFVSIQSGSSIYARMFLTGSTSKAGAFEVRNPNGFVFGSFHAADSTNGLNIGFYNKINFLQTNAAATTNTFASNKPAQWNVYSGNDFTFGGFGAFGGQVNYTNLQNNSSSLIVYCGDQIRASFPSGNVSIGKNVSTSYALDITGNVVITGSTTVLSTLSGTTAQFTTITGSTIIATNLTSSRALISSSNGTVSGSSLIVYGSGTTQPVFTVQGSQGELFSITDSLSGSLFSVNDISGLPILEVYSNNETIIGDYQAPSLYTTKKITSVSGSNTIYNFATSSYDGAFVDYTIRSGSNARAGHIMAIWSGSSVNFTETTTTDFGTTTDVSFGFAITGSNMLLSASCVSASWAIKTIIRSI